MLFQWYCTYLLLIKKNIIYINIYIYTPQLKNNWKEQLFRVMRDVLSDAVKFKQSFMVENSSAYRYLVVVGGIMAPKMSTSNPRNH